MAHWLFKSEPFKWSWQDQVAAGERGTAWDGVRNHAAKLNLLKMAVGERGLFYHSNEGKEIVGIVEVIRAAYPDPTAEPGAPWVVVDLKSVEPLPQPVTLAAIKATPALADMALLKYSRLSVQPVSDAEWVLICRMGGLAV
ncbi:EVE domain-containing protein [Blastochloris viridis]|uniref:EVE domain protein n=1 Tax=Blastochloris viridis TaxID=1079 RepID=A0A0H5B9A0_BLAVI|nr:EVE domain-containing protein [Blastochloris viridis]ALK07954.1 EVE domain protein [Blastochloris viridis]BAR98790.1 RNA-binding protein [Blastochloris viridis]CUU43876.1 EVE domain protein [Blastochloris viridis]